jgi:hypothetical protein
MYIASKYLLYTYLALHISYIHYPTLPIPYIYHYTKYSEKTITLGSWKEEIPTTTQRCSTSIYVDNADSNRHWAVNHFQPVVSLLCDLEMSESCDPSYHATLLCLAWFIVWVDQSTWVEEMAMSLQNVPVCSRKHFSWFQSIPFFIYEKLRNSHSIECLHLAVKFNRLVL